MQMENLQGNGKNRDCMLIGGFAAVATAAGVLAGPVGIFAGLAAGYLGGVGTSISMGCFSN